MAGGLLALAPLYPLDSLNTLLASPITHPALPPACNRPPQDLASYQRQTRPHLYRLAVTSLQRRVRDARCDQLMPLGAMLPAGDGSDPPSAPPMDVPCTLVYTHNATLARLRRDHNARLASTATDLRACYQRLDDAAEERRKGARIADAVEAAKKRIKVCFQPKKKERFGGGGGVGRSGCALGVNVCGGFFFGLLDCARNTCGAAAQPKPSPGCSLVCRVSRLLVGCVRVLTSRSQRRSRYDCDLAGRRRGTAATAVPASSQRRSRRPRPSRAGTTRATMTVTRATMTAPTTLAAMAT